MSFLPLLVDSHSSLNRWILYVLPLRGGILPLIGGIYVLPFTGGLPLPFTGGLPLPFTGVIYVFSV
jgi:hypothetical protein